MLVVGSLQLLLLLLPVPLLWPPPPARSWLEVTLVRSSVDCRLQRRACRALTATAVLYICSSASHNDLRKPLMVPTAPPSSANKRSNPAAA
jgi:hypothetical protein